MGMMIANPIQTLKYLRTSGVFPFSTKEGVLYLAESLDVVIATMRKYQKIEQIISDGYLQGKSSGEMLLGIKGVMNKND